MITGFSLPLAALPGVAFDARASDVDGAGTAGDDGCAGAAESAETPPCVAALVASGMCESY
jgi:hypothetical protein